MTALYLLHLTFLSATICQATDPQISKGILLHQYSHTKWLTLVHDLNNVADTEFSIRGRALYHDEASLTGCTPWKPFAGNPEDSPIGIVKRGGCSFLEKIKYAQSAKLKGLIIINTEDSVLQMAFDESELEVFQSLHRDDLIPAMMAPSSFDEFLRGSSPAMQHSDILVTSYKPSMFDPVMLVAVLVSTLIVAAGAWYSSDVERAKMYYSSGRSSTAKLRRRQSAEEIDAAAAWSFVGAASCGLLVMYFFVDYIFYGVLTVFCFGATNGLSTIFSHSVDFVAPSLQNKHFSVGGWRCTGSLTFSASDFLGFVPAAMLTTAFCVFRLSDWGWILQNIMCLGLLLVLQRSVRISTMRIAAILLTTAFVYDVFWVFLSPMFFESSPMIKVATYQHSVDSRDTLPVVLKFPRIDDPFHHPMVLGLGDIALPGLFVSYLLRFDYLSKTGMSWKRGYFLPAVLGYAVGMAMTDINLILMSSGQPALLFLVPCTLGLTCVLGWGRGHFQALWRGTARLEAMAGKHKVTPTAHSADYNTESRQPLINVTGASMSV